MGSNLHSFEDLRIWRDGMNLCNEIYTNLKFCKDYSLRDQMQRSAVSIPSNIAEGFELHTNKAFIRHFYISKASGGELRTQLFIAVQQGYIDKVIGAKLIESAAKLNRMISSFIASRKGKERSA